jgi:hypothetical protein
LLVKPPGGLLIQRKAIEFSLASYYKMAPFLYRCPDTGLSVELASRRGLA